MRLLTITFASPYVTYVECRIIVRISLATDYLIAMCSSGQMPQMHSRMHMHKCSGEIFLFFFFPKSCEGASARCDATWEESSWDTRHPSDCLATRQLRLSGEHYISLVFQ